MGWVELIFGHEIWHWLMIGLLAAAGIACIIEFPSRIGAIVGTLLLCGAVIVLAYDEGYRSAHNDERVIDLQQQIAQKNAVIAEREKEAKDAQEVADAAAAREAEAAEQSAQLQQKVDEYVQHLNTRPECVATDDDVRGLQSIGASVPVRPAKPAAHAPAVRTPFPPPRPKPGG